MSIMMGGFAIALYFGFLWTYWIIRPKQALSITDLFVVWFSLQYGFHAAILHDYLEVAYKVQHIYQNYIMGLMLTYFGLIFSFIFFGYYYKIYKIKMYPLKGGDLSEKNVPTIFFISILYVLFFCLIQKFDLSRTISYLNFFSGAESIYTYTELRREVYAEDFSVSVASLLRQSMTAIIIGMLTYASIQFKKWRIFLIATAILVFIICSMQMNKFPVLYTGIVTILIIFLNKAYLSGQFLKITTILKIIVGVFAFLSLLTLLYYLQYKSEIDSGVVSWDRILFRIIYRPFTANHDGLYLWFDFFPKNHNFLWFDNISIISEIFGREYFLPTAYLPEYYGFGFTTFQAGFIGSGYASFGYLGILFYSIIVGFLVMTLTYYESKISEKWMRVLYTSIVGMNFYFFTSRELHTSLLSGGILFAPFLFLVIAFFSKSKVK